MPLAFPDIRFSLYLDLFVGPLTYNMPQDTYGHAIIVLKKLIPPAYVSMQTHVDFPFVVSHRMPHCRPACVGRNLAFILPIGSSVHFLTRINYSSDIWVIFSSHLPHWRRFVQKKNSNSVHRQNISSSRSGEFSLLLNNS